MHSESAQPGVRHVALAEIERAQAGAGARQQLHGLVADSLAAPQVQVAQLVAVL